jgi:hypothetical protein
MKKILILFFVALLSISMVMAAYGPAGEASQPAAPAGGSSESTSSSSSGGGGGGGGGSGCGEGFTLENGLCVKSAETESESNLDVPTQESDLDVPTTGESAPETAGEKGGAQKAGNIAGQAFFDKVGNIVVDLSWLWISIVILGIIAGLIVFIKLRK